MKNLARLIAVLSMAVLGLNLRAMTGHDNVVKEKKNGFKIFMAWEDRGGSTHATRQENLSQGALAQTYVQPGTVVQGQPQYIQPEQQMMVPQQQVVPQQQMMVPQQQVVPQQQPQLQGRRLYMQQQRQQFSETLTAQEQAIQQIMQEYLENLKIEYVKTHTTATNQQIKQHMWEQKKFYLQQHPEALSVYQKVHNHMQQQRKQYGQQYTQPAPTQVVPQQQQPILVPQQQQQPVLVPIQ